MQTLRVSNQYLGDRKTLATVWDRDGYWFFQEVLDRNAVGNLRQKFADQLVANHAVSPGDSSFKYLGSNQDLMPGMEALAHARVWRDFVASPKIAAFFRGLLGDEPFWIPIAEFRATPPAADPSAPRMVGIHQDGFYNEGIPFKICWVPLSECDEDVGGIVIAEGMHKGPYLHDRTKPPKFRIPGAAIPEAAWRRATYRPGDILIFHRNAPHTGLTNLSDRFRLSMDIRVIEASCADLPVIGKILAATPDVLTVRADSGLETTVVIEDHTLLRDTRGLHLHRADYARTLSPGTEVIVAHQGGRASVVRPSH